MEFKGTKGKWSHSELMNFSGTLVSFIRTNDKSVAQLRGCSTDEVEEAEANAKLIACAPELLDQLKKLYNSIDSCVDLTPELLIETRDLIKRATE